MSTEADSFSTKRHYVKWIVAALIMSTIMHGIAAARESWAGVAGVGWLLEPLNANIDRADGILGTALLAINGLIGVLAVGLMAGWLTLQLKRATEQRS